MAETASSGAGSEDGTRRNLDLIAAPGLPDDLVQWEILVRLPTKDILGCRAACRSWLRLNCNDEFLLAHHRRQPSLPLVSFHSRLNGHLTDALVDATVDAFDLWQTPAVRLPVLGFNDYSKRRNFSIHGSCDGLLLLSLSNHGFYICNPATRQWLPLPALTGGNVVALYAHRPSGEYRVLYWKLSNKDTSDSAAFYVLAVGSSEGPRCIGLPVPSPTMKNVTTRWLTRAFEHLPVLLHDCLHWQHWYVSSMVVVVFDTLAESFKWMESPIATNNSAMLFQMDGKFVLNNGDKLVAISFESCSPYTPLRSYLAHCDGRGMLKKKYQWENVNPMVLGLCFKESLVRHVFFQRKDAAGRVRVPRFFRGL